jgi:hypothetical protein
MKIYLFTVLFFSCSISCLQFPGSVDKRIRENFISTLKRFHSTTQPPLSIRELSQSTSCPAKRRNRAPVPRTSHELEGLPRDIATQSIGSFLDFKSLISWRQTSALSNNISKLSVKFRLARFNPYFVFDDLLINDLLLFVLDEHFSESENLNSPAIRDELQVLILKFSLDDLNYNVIPRNIYFYIISFINSTLNGLNSTVGVSKQMCFLDAIRSISMHDFPKTLEYLITHKPEKQHKNYIKNLMFFSRRPSIGEIRAEFKILDIEAWIRTYSIHVLFKILVAEYLIEDFTPEGALNLSHIYYGEYFKSPIIVNRIVSDINENRSAVHSMAHFCVPFDLIHAVCVKNADSNSKCEFILKRIVVSDADQAVDFTNSTLIESIIKSFIHFEKRSNLFQIDLYSRCINSPFIDVNKREYLIDRMSPISIHFYLEAMIKENSRSFNVFWTTPSQYKYIMRNFVSQLESDTDLSIFFELLNSDDPMAVLILLPKSALLASKRHITDKFDLNKSYRIHFSHWTRSSFKLDIFKDRTVHFKQIIKELNDPVLKRIFSSNPREFDGNFDVTYPVVPITRRLGSKYFTEKKY